MSKFYIDTSIWMDFYEDRKGFKGEPLGKVALKLLSYIISQKKILVVSDLLIKELEKNYSINEINGMVNPFIKEKVIAESRQCDEAERISQKRELPRGDSLHAILARDSGAILITRDKHFMKLEDICPHFKPEDII